MSFILDALRKSEHEREKKSLPGLADVPLVQRPRSRLPLYLGLLGALLAVNLVVLLAMLFRKDDAPAPLPPPPAAAPAPTVASLPPEVARALPDVAGLAIGTAADVRPLEDEALAAAPAVEDYPEPPPPEPRLDAGAVRPGRVLVLPPEERPPDVPPVPRAEPFAARAAPAPATTGVPTIDELSPQATAGLPPFNIDLHVYSKNAAQRFVVLNGRRYVEGAALAEGPTLERITADGVVLNRNGTRFLVPRD